jgi:hypothetical protein
MKDVTYMCLLLSRIPIVKDMLVNNAETQKAPLKPPEEEDASVREGDSIVYDDGGDDFSYAVYDDTTF